MGSPARALLLALALCACPPAAPEPAGPAPPEPVPAPLPHAPPPPVASATTPRAPTGPDAPARSARPERFAPRTLAGSVRVGSFGLAADDRFAYAVGYEEGLLVRVPLQGGDAEPLATGQEWSRDIAVDGTHVYWVRGHGAVPGGAVLTIPKAGGTPRELYRNQADAHCIALDDAFVYWANGGGYDGAGSVLPAAIRRGPKRGGPIEPLADGGWVVRIIVTGDELFFLGANEVVGGKARVARMPKQGGPVTVLAEAGQNPEDFDLDATHVYFTVAGPFEQPPQARCTRPPCPMPTAAPIVRRGELWRVPRAGGQPERLAGGLKRAGHVVVGQRSVLVSSVGGLVEVPLGGGAPTLSDGPRAGSRFALSNGVAYSLGDALVAYGP